MNLSTEMRTGEMSGWTRQYFVRIGFHTIATGYATEDDALAAIAQCADAETYRDRTIVQPADQSWLFNANDYNACPGCQSPIGVGNPFVYAGNGLNVGIARWDRPIVGCEYCYVNEQCPAQCSIPHPAPEHSTEFRCPHVTPVFAWNVWVWCDDCNDWVEQDHAGTVIDGEHYCDPYEHGYDSCNYCNAMAHTDYGTYSCSDYGDAHFYCRSCEDHAHDYCCGSEDDDYYSDGDDYDSSDHDSHSARCEEYGSSCERTITHYDPITEIVTCAACAGATSLPIPEMIAA